MMALLSIAWSFLSGPIGRWLLISAVSLGFMAWLRADARAPYEAKVTELETAIRNRDMNAERDRRLAEAQATEATERSDALERMLAELKVVAAEDVAAAASAGCKLSPPDLDRLRKLGSTTRLR